MSESHLIGLFKSMNDALNVYIWAASDAEWMWTFQKAVTS